MTYLPTDFSNFYDSCLNSFANPFQVKNGDEVCGVAISTNKEYQRKFSKLYDALVREYYLLLFGREITDTLRFLDKFQKWLDEKQKQNIANWIQFTSKFIGKIRKNEKYKKLNDKQIGEILFRNSKQKIQKLSEELLKLLEDADYNPQNIKEITFRGLVKQTLNYGTLDKGNQEKGKIYFAMLSEKQKGRGDIEFFYLDEDIGEQIEQIFEIEDDQERKEAIDSLKRAIIEKILKEIVNLKDIDEEVKVFFEQTLKIYRLGEVNPLAREVSKRLIKIQVDIATGYVEEVEDKEYGVFKVFKPILTKLGYGNPTSEINDLNYEQVLERIATAKDIMKLLGKHTYQRKEELQEAIEEIEFKLEQIGAVEPLKKIYGNGKEKFLERIRNSLVKLINGGSSRIKSVKFVKEEKPSYKIKGIKVECPLHSPIIAYEEEVNKEEFYNFLKNIRKVGTSYLNIKNNLTPNQVIISIEDLFPYWKQLKRTVDRKKNLIEGEKGKKVLATLIEFGAFMEAVRILGDKQGIRKIPFFLLNVENLNEFFAYWNAFRALMEAIDYPSQTLTKRMLKDLSKNKSTPSLLKNTYLSALRGDKKLTVNLEDLAGQLKKGEYYILIENTSKAIRRGEELNPMEEFRHYLYKVLKIEINNKGANNYQINIIEEKTFYLLSEGVKGDKEDLVKFLQETKKPIVVISPYPRGFMKEILSKPAKGDRYFALYKLFPTIYRNFERAAIKDTKNAIVVYEADFEKGLRKIGFSRNPIFAKDEDWMEQYTLLAIRSPKVIPKHLENYPYFSYTLNLFFVSNLKGKNPSDEASILFTLFSWLIFENESWTFFYSKPKFIPLKLPKVSFTRKFKIENETLERKIVIPLNLVVFELAYLFNRWKEESSAIF
jgi:hypothetical protein